MRALLHGGFKNLTAPQRKTAWAEFFSEIGRVNPAFALFLPWALPANSHDKAYGSFTKRAKSCWDFNFQSQLILTSAELSDALKNLPQNATILIYLPGGILVENCVAEMQGFSESDFPPQTVFAGFSAGAYALTDYYFNPRKKQIVSGGGLFKGCVCCHADTQRLAQMALSIKEKHRPVFSLQDGAFCYVSTL